MRAESFLKYLSSSLIWSSLEKVSGLLKHVVLASAIGLSAQLDVFYMANVLLNLAVLSLAGILDTLPLPALIRHRQAGDQARFDRLTAGLFSLSLGVGFGLGALFLLGSELLVGAAFGLEPIRRAMLAESFLWLLPVIVLTLPLRTLGTIFRSVRQFSISNHIEFLCSAVILALIWCFPHDPHVLLWSFSGGVSCALVYALAHGLWRFKLWGPLWGPELREAFRGVGPASWAFGFQYLQQLCERYFLTFLAVGAFGALMYGLTITLLVPLVVGLRRGFLTVFTEKRLQSEAAASEVFNHVVSLAIGLSVPLSLFLLAFGNGVIAFLLERGAFTADDTRLTSQALWGYAALVLPFFLRGPCDVVVQFFGRFDLLVRRTLWALLLNVGCNSLFVFVFHWGVFGVALSTTLSYLALAALSLTIVQRLGVAVQWWHHARWFALTTAIALFAALIVQGVGHWLPPAFAFPGKAILYLALVALPLALSPLPESHLARATLRRFLSISSAT